MPEFGILDGLDVLLYLVVLIVGVRRIRRTRYQVVMFVMGGLLALSLLIKGLSLISGTFALAQAYSQIDAWLNTAGLVLFLVLFLWLWPREDKEQGPPQ